MAARGLCLLFSFSVLATLVAARASVPVSANMKTFGTAIKNGFMPADKELTLYEFQEGPGVVTEQWYTGPPMDFSARIRIYIDGETTASLDYNLYLAHGVGASEDVEQQYEPWGTSRIAHAANNGAIYNTYRIPFMQSLRVTVTHPVGGIFWYIIRGVTNYPLIVGDLQLPQKTRLQLFKNEGVILQPLEYITLAQVNASAGLLFQVTISGNSTDFNYLEACVRAYMDSTTPQFLSSGTEDYFLSAYYFDKGVFHFPNSGLTHIGGPGSMTAYKFHENDPVLFTTNFTLQWRCGEDAACPTTWPPNAPSASTERVLPRPALAPTNVTTYAWVYTYQL